MVERESIEVAQDLSFTPRELVGELDRHIVGQGQAKRAVAIALRNRWRRQRVAAEMREDISPKNIIMIGPTGVGKTEIARRLAKLVRAPFIKVEASKFTEVGYVGRDVDSIIRDLMDLAVGMMKKEEQERVIPRAQRRAEDRLLELLVPSSPRPAYEDASLESQSPEPQQETREKFRKMLRSGDLDERVVTIETQAKPTMPMVEVFSAPSMDDLGSNMQDLLGNMLPRKSQKREMPVPEALEVLTEQEAERLVDMEEVIRSAVHRVEQSGIVFLDEVDKIAGRGNADKGGGDISRQGVQRDILPIVEGSTVKTKHGMVRTDHILFIAAGAFHVASPSDLIPELQGRFPIRVELDSLDEHDFQRILTEPKNALTKQYTAMMETEGVDLQFDESAIEEIAHTAAEANRRLENIGARRLHTVLEKLLEELSFHAPEQKGQKVVLSREDVQAQLADVLADEDLSRYIL